MSNVKENPNAAHLFKRLTPRQLDTVKLIAQGKINKVIAHELNLTEGTVKSHISRVLDMWKVNGREEAILMYLANADDDERERLLSPWRRQ